jgi:hypothetical protein
VLVGDHLCGAVARRVVDHDDLEFQLTRMRAEALQAGGQVIARVPVDDAD